MLSCPVLLHSQLFFQVQNGTSYELKHGVAWISHSLLFFGIGYFQFCQFEAVRILQWDMVYTLNPDVSCVHTHPCKSDILRKCIRLCMFTMDTDVLCAWPEWHKHFAI